MQKDPKWVIRAEYNLSLHLSFARVTRFIAPGQGFCVSGKVESRGNQFSHSIDVIGSSQVARRGVKAEQTA